MDKESKNKTTKVKNSTDVIKEQVEKLDELENNDSAETVVNIDTQPVVVKKSSGGLSLLVSLLALAGVVYLFYKDWQSNSLTANSAEPAAVIQQLKDSDQVLSTEIQNAQVDINRIKQQTAQISIIEQQLKQLSDQLSAQGKIEQNANQVGTNTQFDNSSNELALARIQQQLTEQTQTITDLQTKSAVVGTHSSASDGLSDTYEQIEKNAAIQVLLTTDVLISTHRLPQAVAALDNYLKVSGLKSADKNKMLRLLNQLQQIQQPDLAQIEQQLKALKATVHGLQVSTQAAANEAPKWYERFVSVKKIETESSISSTVQLVAFKTELNRLLYQAKLYLMLNDQAGWQSSLNAAAKWSVAEMPENDVLSNRIKELANQAVVADIPNQLDVAAVIEELSGLH